MHFVLIHANHRDEASDLTCADEDDVSPLHRHSVESKYRCIVSDEVIFIRYGNSLFPAVSDTI